MEDIAPRQKIIQALAQGDESTRDERADRLEWISRVDSRPSAFWGPLDTSQVLREAHSCFIDGHNVACILLATSFLEHTLSDELAERGLIKGKPTLGNLLELARANLDFPTDLLERADRLRNLRNPFVHRRPPEDETTFGSRFKAARTHPDNILEADGKLAISVMYELFAHTLRRA